MKKRALTAVLLMFIIGSLFAGSVSLSLSAGITTPEESTMIISGMKEDDPTDDGIFGGIDGRMGIAYNFTDYIGLGCSFGLTWSPSFGYSASYSSLSTIQALADIVICPSAGDYAIVRLPIYLSVGGYMEAYDWSGWDYGPMVALTIGPRIQMSEICHLDIKAGAELLFSFSQDMGGISARVNARCISVGLTFDFPTDEFEGFSL